MMTKDKGYYLSKLSGFLSAEDVRILLLLRDKKMFFCKEAPYASTGMTLIDIHLTVHPWAIKPTLPHARYNQAWLNGLKEMIRQRLIIEVVLDDGPVKCISQKGLDTLKKLEKDYEEYKIKEEEKNTKKEKAI